LPSSSTPSTDTSPGDHALDAPILSLENVGRRARQTEHWLLRELNWQLRCGQRVGILGRSGTGKTVFLRSLAMLDPWHSGQLRWHGRTVAGSHVPAYRRSVTYLHQQPVLLYGTVADNLQAPFQLRSGKGATLDVEQAREWLAQLDRNPQFWQQQVGNLSGGESQIVALVRALAIDPEVLLLDEPTSALDAKTTQLVEQLLVDWCQQQPRRRAFVWVSHDADQIARVTVSQFYVNEGRLGCVENSVPMSPDLRGPP
jgi:putative ABC transport system ATP-binding protein